MQIEHPQAALLPPLLIAPKVPWVVRIYALIIMLLNTITALKFLTDFLVVALTSRTWTLKMFGSGSLFYLASIVIALIWIRLGYGLRLGQRKAVYGFVCFSVISEFFSYNNHKTATI